MNTDRLVIKSCAHCGCKAKVLLVPVTADSYLVGWECTACRESVSTICIHDMINYNIKKMGRQWNMRVAINNENQTSYSGPE
jgi:isoprenylcysteine carboxyl methyltransferase (ICMT) family protein YpbQ